MDLRFYLDPETALPHIHDHGVTEDEVRQVLARPASNSPAGRNARTIMGQTLAGRYLKVVFVPDPTPESGFVVTAYELRGKALKAFRREQRRKAK
jgi:hypothetical protein